MCKRKFTDVSENTASQLRVTRQRLVSITEPQRRLIDTRQLSHRLPNELWEEIYLAALLDDNYVNVVDIFFADEAFTQILSTQRVYHALVLKSLHQGPRCLEMDTETHNRNNNDRLAERTTMEADYNESVTILLNQSWFTMSLYKKAMTKYFSNIVIGAYQEWTKEHNLPVSNQQEELLRELISSGYALLRPTKTSMESSVRHRIHDPISEQIIHFRLIAGKSLLTIQSWKIKKSRSDRTRHDTYINRPRTARGVPLPPRVFSGDFNAEDLFFLQLLVSRGCTVSKRPTDAFLANIAVENAIRAHNLPAIRVLLGPMNTRHATPISPPTFFYTADWHVPLPEVLDSQKERFCFDKLTAAARAGTPFAYVGIVPTHRHLEIAVCQSGCYADIVARLMFTRPCWPWKAPETWGTAVWQWAFRDIQTGGVKGRWLLECGNVGLVRRREILVKRGDTWDRRVGFLTRGVEIPRIGGVNLP